MKLLDWIKARKFSISDAAKQLEIDYCHLYNYLYFHTIPRAEVMVKIYEKTQGVVTPNDFYDLAQVDQAKQKIVKKSERSNKRKKKNEAM